ADIDAGTGKLAPTAVLALLISQAIGDFDQRLPAVASIGHGLTLLAEDELHEQVFAFKDRIAFQLRPPVTIIMLKALQCSDRSIKRPVKSVIKLLRQRFAHNQSPLEMGWRGILRDQEYPSC